MDPWCCDTKEGMSWLYNRQSSSSFRPYPVIFRKRTSCISFLIGGRCGEERKDEEVVGVGGVHHPLFNISVTQDRKLHSLNLRCIFGTSGRRSSRSTVRWSTGNDVSGHYFHHYFPFHQIKNFLAKVDGSGQKPGGRPLSRPR